MDTVFTNRSFEYLESIKQELRELGITIDPVAILSKSREQDVVFQRACVAYFLRVKKQLTLINIGFKLRMNHASVIYLLKYDKVSVSAFNPIRAMLQEKFTHFKRTLEMDDEASLVLQINKCSEDIKALEERLTSLFKQLRELQRK